MSTVHMSKENYRMSEPELRSIEMLQSVAKETPAVEIVIMTHESIKVRLRGESMRWYSIESKFQGISGNSVRSQPEWSIAVKAGRRQNDVIHENEYSVNLCLHSKNQNLPIGDRIVSLVLALFNDIKTALKIPMLAQFIVCQRQMLKDIVIFQDTMIVTHDMVEDEWDYPEEWDEEDMDHHEEEMHESIDEMYDLQQAWEDEMHELEQAQQQQEEAEEKKQEREQELIDFWELMADKLLDK